MAAQSAADSKAATVREARRKLHSRIKNDWSFEYADFCPHVSTAAASTSGRDLESQPSPLSQSADSGDVADDESGHELLLHEDEDGSIEGRALAWVERTYASSDPSSDEDIPSPSLPEDARAPPKPELHTRRKRDILFLGHRRDGSGSSQHARSSSETYALADSAQPAVECMRRQARRQRRRGRLEEEMSWNEGLRFWQARRDAWCSAKKVHEKSVEEHTTADASDGHDSGHASSGSPERPVAANQDTPVLKGKDKLRKTPSEVTLIPVPPPLIAEDDPIHININSTLYHSIYSKVVLQSLTPSVPINLSHMIPALVDGWRRDGEWPPKSYDTAAPAPVVSRERAMQQQQEASRLGMSHVRRGMARVKRGLRLSLSGGSASGTPDAEI